MPIRAHPSAVGPDGRLGALPAAAAVPARAGARTAVALLAALMALGVTADDAAATRRVRVRTGDPARVAGDWEYRTRSNCGRVEGVGRVSFTWDAAAGVYEERGHVFWADSGLTVRWWGPTRWDPARRRLEGRLRNSLGDEVEGGWQLEGAGPDRLVVVWEQTNGCRGIGVARRALPRAR